MLATDSPPATIDKAALGAAGPNDDHQAGIAHGIVPIGFTLLLLVLATTSQGAFAISRWAPLALFALAMLIGVVITRGHLALAQPSVRVVLAGIWGLVGWSLLSMLWAKSSSNALVGASELALYAGIVTLPFALPLSRRALAGAALALAAGIGLVAVYVLIRLLVDPSPLFLAGRLNGPINYRNATALLFALPVWPFVVVTAARTYPRGIRACAFALAVLCLALVFLTQARGTLLGLVVGACVALALGPDRVRRVWVAVLAVGSVAAASHWLLRPFHAFDGGHGTVRTHDIAVAAHAATLLTLVALVLGMLIALFDSGLRPNSPQMRHVHRAARIVLALGVAVAVAGGLVAIGNPVSFVHRKWDQFHQLNSSTPTTTRYASVGGQRYDLWRVAVKEFESAPLGGVGVQNYQFGYYRDRTTNRNLNDPHSLVFALLGETGAVGVLLFVVFLGGIVVVVRRGWPALDPQTRRNATAALAAGTVLLGQSAVDWIWLIPGLTAVGLLLLAFGAALAATGIPSRSRAERAAPPSAATRRTTIVRLAAAAALTLAALSVLSVYVSNAYIQRARSSIDHPQAELAAARTAAALNPWSVTPHYLQASAYETLGDRSQAYTQLNDALKLEPQNFATLGVLGDFEVRGGNITAGRAYYRRALALNPKDVGLQQLARIGLRSRGR